MRTLSFWNIAGIVVFCMQIKNKQFYKANMCVLQYLNGWNMARWPVCLCVCVAQSRRSRSFITVVLPGFAERGELTARALPPGDLCALTPPMFGSWRVANGYRCKSAPTSFCSLASLLTAIDTNVWRRCDEMSAFSRKSKGILLIFLFVIQISHSTIKKHWKAQL